MTTWLKVTISAEAERALRARTKTGEYDFDAPVANADGTFTIKLEKDTLGQLRKVAFRGESISDVILRVCALAGRKAN